GRICGNLAERNKTVQRGNVDNASILIAEHMRAEYLASAQRPGQVSVNDALPLVFRKRKRGSALDFSSAVDQDVHHLILGYGLVQQALERGTILHVGSDAEGMSAVDRVKFRSCFFHLFRATRRRHNRRARMGETEAESATQSGRASDDDCCFSFKTQRCVGHFTFTFYLRSRNTEAMLRSFSGVMTLLRPTAYPAARPVPTLRHIHRAAQQ